MRGLIPAGPQLPPQREHSLGAAVVAGNYTIVYTTNGDAYVNVASANHSGPWVRAGNVFSGGTIEMQQESWGQLKARYR